MPNSSFTFSSRKLLNMSAGILSFGLVALGFLEGLLYFSGESLAPESIIETQKKYPEKLYRQRFSPHDGRYKEAAFLAGNPSLVTLGSSRAACIGEECFSDNLSSYNLSVSGKVLDGIRGLEKYYYPLIQEKSGVKVILLTIDPWVFNPNYEVNLYERADPSEPKINRVRRLVTGKPVLEQLFLIMRAVQMRLDRYRLMLSEPGLFSILMKEQTHLGIKANLSDSGFRLRDGRNVYEIAKRVLSEKRVSKETISKRFANGRDIWFADPSYKDWSLDQHAEQRFRGLLAEMKKDGYRVVGMLLPFHPNYHEVIENFSSQTSFFKNFRQSMKDVFHEKGMVFYDYSEYTSSTIPLRESFIDYYHPTHLLLQEIFDQIPPAVFMGAMRDNL
jgi:hypothetical protein